jgi:thioredoxin 1
MKVESRNRINNSRIFPVTRTVLFVLTVFVVTGLLSVSVIRHGVVLDNGIPSGNTAVAADSLPVLVDLGADRCVPCKMMAPILEELKKEYKGKLDVVFYDVWKDPAPAEKYRIHGIPTQVFLDETGKELYRHAGYFSKEQILNKWKELGYDFQ